MATVQREVSDRTFFGKIIKWVFIGFNIVMLIWMIAGMAGAAETASTASSEAEQAGAAIGTGIGFMMLLMIWAAGDVVLGLFVMLTRRKKLITVDA
jgi:beta-lactamase regulating signal transducer with metallopeptidase domain